MAGENPVPDIPTSTQRENLSIDEILVPVQEVLVPAEYLPSTIPVYQRLKDAPYKFRVVAVSVKQSHAYWESRHYFLTDGEGLVDIAERALYYKTRAHGKVYKVKISEGTLPKELKHYARGMRVDIRERDGDVHVLVNMKGVLELQGDLTRYDEKNFVVSVLFRILPHLPLD
jgi:hypothetical protein